MEDLPAAVLMATIWAYWTCVAALIVRLRRKHRKRSGVVPKQGLERVMWIVWVPVVVAWLVLPYLAATRTATPWGIPQFAHAPPWTALRWGAASAGVICLALTIECWVRMGASWRMAVTPGETTKLVTGGLYAHIRHPIYALSILLMLCSAVVVPTAPMLVVAAVHVALMMIKARNEEAFLLGMHGDVYARYARRTGRFFPRFGRRDPDADRPR
jgi:protein-S-isoprenylcysteine O-methyltransferase Ste14